MNRKVMLSYPLVDVIAVEFIEPSDSDEFGVRVAATARYDMSLIADQGDRVLYVALHWMAVGALPPRAVRV
jgi:hypothetical protein